MPLAVRAASVAASAASVAASAARRRCAGANRTAAGHLAEADRATLCLLNETRRAHGLGPLRDQGELGRAATGHSRAMIHGRFFAHGAFTSRLLPYTRGHAFMIGENIAAATGSRSSPRAIVRAWMHSPPHRQNILTGQFRDIGIGVARGTPNGAAGATCTTDFGRRG